MANAEKSNTKKSIQDELKLCTVIRGVNKCDRCTKQSDLVFKYDEHVACSKSCMELILLDERNSSDMLFMGDK